MLHAVLDHLRLNKCQLLFLLLKLRTEAVVVLGLLVLLICVWNNVAIFYSRTVII